MTTHRKSGDHLRHERRDRLIQEWVHDPYRAKVKYPEPAVCRDCGAVLHHGHWTWGPAPEGAHEDRCPACRRIHDRVPAAFLTMSGAFLAAHRDEILHLVRNVEAREKTERPLERIMGVEDAPDGEVTATFTDPHLARAAGEAVHHAYAGDLDLHYVEGEYLLRVTWRRDG